MRVLCVESVVFKDVSFDFCCLGPLALRRWEGGPRRRGLVPVPVPSRRAAMRVSALGLGPGLGPGLGLVLVLGLAATACASRLSPLDRLLRTRFPSTTQPPSLSSDYDASYEDDQDLDDFVTGAPLLNDDARHVWVSTHI